MAQSTYLRGSNETAHKWYIQKRLTAYGSFRDGHPGLVNPLLVQDNTIMLLVETGVFVDNEHTNQPAQSEYTVVKKDKIGIRYLEIADDAIEVTVGEVNGGVFNGYGRQPASHDRPDPKRGQIYTCSSLGGQYDFTNKVWKIWNAEFNIVGSLATDHAQMAYYQIRPAHEYGVFKNLVMNDWCDATVPPTGMPKALDPWWNTGSTKYTEKGHPPKTQYAPVREIIVHGSKMGVINLNSMQYVYFIYIAGYVSLKCYKFAACAVLKEIGSLGLYGPLLPQSVAMAGDSRAMQYAFASTPNLKHSPGIGDDISGVTFDALYLISGITTAPWIDMSKGTTARSLFAYSGITGTPPDYDYRNLTEAAEIYNHTAITSFSKPLQMLKVTTLSSAFSTCAKLNKKLSINAPKLTNIYRIAYDCTLLPEFELLGGSKLTDIRYAFYQTPALKKVNLFDTSICNDSSSMFEYSGIETIPAFNFSNVVDGDYTFSDSKLATCPALNFSKATSLRALFNATKLTAIPQLTTTAALTDTRMMFGGCTLIAGNFDNYADSTPVTHASFNTTGVTLAENMFSQTKLTRLEIYLPKATKISGICWKCTSLTTINIRLTDGVIINTSSAYEGCSKARWDNLNVTGYTSAITNAARMYKNIDWNTPDNTGTVFVNLPAATDISEMLYGVHGRQWIKLQNVSKLTSSGGGSLFGTPNNYPWTQFPARKLWIVNGTCEPVFYAWKQFSVASSMASATFEITLESVSNFDPIFVNAMVRLTKITFINEPLDFQATAGLWVASHNFQTNPLLTEINLQGSMTPEFIKALQVVAPTTVNYTGNITILHHNDLAWT